ncbi:MAG: SUMF1/EgtB/PvdO family nonheme iron enzyme, partial [Planctomycetes bacterium]|nr:SUMF1/EgtB/PvdO family nonheme iron enzyme [Planctomycetota bacterium]
LKRTIRRLVEDALALTRTGDFSGTPYYMSPEQVMSRKAGIDKRTDIYSLGVTLYEMLTLKPPFEGKTSIEVMKRICLVDPTDPHKVSPRVPHDLSVICLKTMEKNPENRYQTMKEYAEDLHRFLNGDVILAKPAGMKTRAWKRMKQHPVLSTTVSVTLLLLFCFIGYELFYSIPRLKHERDKALAAEKKAEEQARVIQEDYGRIIRLSDVKFLSELNQEADKLWPAHPENIDKLKDWLRRACELLQRLEEHRHTLASLRALGVPGDNDNRQPGEEKAGPDSLIFEDMETRWWHDTLAELVTGLTDLADEKNGLVKKVEDRLTFAETIEKISLMDHRAAWDEAMASIADEGECPRYAGLKIEPQIGFVPLGRDIDSGLWEFAHLQTGEIPARGEDGKLLLTEESGLVFVLIPGGSFRMGCIKPSADRPAGSSNVDPQAGPDENPVHEVTLKPFFISKYEMTQGQWLHFTGENHSTYSPQWGSATLLHPVEQVNWKDCHIVLQRLKLRFPSESEWEYAARAGTTTIWWTGNENESLRGAANLADRYLKTHGGNPGWPHDEWLDDGFAVTAPVGSLLPNAFGLHDVHGNVLEWCRDGCERYEKTPTDGSALETGESSIRILRGGAWDRTALNCRSAMRMGNIPDFRSSDQGLRPACSLQ